MERRQQRQRALARHVGWLLQLSKELDDRGARATSLLQAMVEFVGAVRAPDGEATNSTAELERERLGQERREAERLAAEQEQQRKDQAERLAELDRPVERERVEAETMELERQQVLERLDAAMARGQEAEHERQEGETALWHQRTQETLKAIRDEAVRVEAARIARGYGVRLSEEDGTLAAKVRTFILDQAADSVDLLLLLLLLIG